MKRLLSILAIAAMATPIIFSSTPAQALTWDDLWGAVKKGIVSGVQMGAESAVQKNMTEQTSTPEDESVKSTAEQSGDSSDEPPAEEVSE
jgi:hypothetical protein